MAPETFGDSLARRATDVATPRLTGTPARSLQMCRYEKSTLHAPLPRGFLRALIRGFLRVSTNQAGAVATSTLPSSNPKCFRLHRGVNTADSTTTTLRILQPHNLADSTTTTSRHPAALAAYLVSRAYALFYLPLMLEFF